MDERSQLASRVQRMSHPDAPGACSNFGNKLIVNRCLHQQATRRGATLPVQAVDHEHHSIQRSVEIGIVEDDYRVFATKLEVNAFQGRGTLGPDGAAGGRFAHEGDGLDVGMLGERSARGFTKPVNRVEHARR